MSPRHFCRLCRPGPVLHVRCRPFPRSRRSKCLHLVQRMSLVHLLPADRLQREYVQPLGRSFTANKLYAVPSTHIDTWSNCVDPIGRLQLQQRVLLCARCARSQEDGWKCRRLHREMLRLSNRDELFQAQCYRVDHAGIPPAQARVLQACQLDGRCSSLPRRGSKLFRGQ